MKFSEILPNFKKIERSAFLGSSGSGKTTLAYKVVSLYPYSIVLDTKHDLNWDGFEIFTNLEKMIENLTRRNSKNDQRILYRPERGFERDNSYELQTKLYEFIWHRKHTALYIDEATQISTSTAICPSLFDLITRGRSRGIPVLCGSQRPSGLKQEFLSESENIYCFSLRLPVDREKAFKFGGIDTNLIEEKNRENKTKHYFIYSKNGSTTKPIIL